MEKVPQIHLFGYGSHYRSKSKYNNNYQSKFQLNSTAGSHCFDDICTCGASSSQYWNQADQLRRSYSTKKFRRSQDNDFYHTFSNISYNNKANKIKKGSNKNYYQEALKICDQYKWLDNVRYPYLTSHTCLCHNSKKNLYSHQYQRYPIKQNRYDSQIIVSQAPVVRQAQIPFQNQQRIISVTPDKKTITATFTYKTPGQPQKIGGSYPVYTGAAANSIPIVQTHIPIVQTHQNITKFQNISPQLPLYASPQNNEFVSTSKSLKCKTKLQTIQTTNQNTYVNNNINNTHILNVKSNDQNNYNLRQTSRFGHQNNTYVNQNIEQVNRNRNMNKNSGQSYKINDRNIQQHVGFKQITNTFNNTEYNQKVSGKIPLFKNQYPEYRQEEQNIKTNANNYSHSNNNTNQSYSNSNNRNNIYLNQSYQNESNQPHHKTHKQITTTTVTNHYNKNLSRINSLNQSLPNISQFLHQIQQTQHQTQSKTGDLLQNLISISKQNQQMKRQYVNKLSHIIFNEDGIQNQNMDQGMRLCGMFRNSEKDVQRKKRKIFWGSEESVEFAKSQKNIFC